MGLEGTGEREKNEGWVLVSLTDKHKSLSCKKPPTFKLKLSNGKPNIKKKISPIVTRLISFSD